MASWLHPQHSRFSEELVLLHSLFSLPWLHSQIYLLATSIISESTQVSSSHLKSSCVHPPHSPVGSQSSSPCFFPHCLSPSIIHHNLQMASIKQKRYISWIGLPSPQRSPRKWCLSVVPEWGRVHDHNCGVPVTSSLGKPTLSLRPSSAPPAVSEVPMQEGSVSQLCSLPADPLLQPAQCHCLRK